MPQPIKQQVRPPTLNGTATIPRVGVPKAGGFLSRATNIAPDEFVHMLLYGRNRTGKTTLSCQFPKPLLLLSCEMIATGGARSVSKVPGVKQLRLGKDAKAELRTSEDLQATGEELKADLGGYKTVVIDSGTALDEIVLAEVCGWQETANMIAVGTSRPGAKVTMDQYTERSERMRRRLRPFLDLKCHVVIIANEKDHNPQEGSRKSSLSRGLHTESFFAAAMGGGTARWVQDGCDYLCQLYIDKEVIERKVTVGSGANKIVSTELEETGRLIRKLRTGYHPNFAAGFRSADPTAVPENIDDPTWEKILRVVRGEKLAAAT